MDMRPVKRYSPPPQAGYVFWSNAGRVDLERRAKDGTPFDLRPDVIAHTAAARFDIPIDDVKVIDFAPDGECGIYGNYYSVFIREQHAGRIAEAHLHLAAIMELLGQIGDDFD